MHTRVCACVSARASLLVTLPLVKGSQNRMLILEHVAGLYCCGAFCVAIAIQSALKIRSVRGCDAMNQAN